MDGGGLSEDGLTVLIGFFSQGDSKTMSIDARIMMRDVAAREQPWTWALFQAHARYWMWQVGSKSILGLIYLAVISEGLRVLIPALGQKVYKLPLLSGLQNFEATYRLDLAPFFAFFLLIAVFVLWPRIIALWMADRDWSSWTQEQRLLVCLGTAILGADAVLFYYAMAQMSWGGSALSFSALVATAAYVGVLVFVSWVSVKLSPYPKG